VTQVNTDPANPLYVPPSNFALGDPPTYYDIDTTATFTGPVVVCLTYPAGAFPPDASPRLFHYVGGQWVDVTTRVDTVARVVCGTVPSFSPFALGFLVLNRGPLVLKRLKVSNPRTKRAASTSSNKGAWSLHAKLNASTASTPFLAEVDTNGVEFELVGRSGFIDKVVFAPGDCSFRRRQAQVWCRVKNQTDALKASFTRGGSAKAKKTTFSVSASFARRRLNITTQQALNALAPFEVRVTTTPATLGVVAANTTKCHVSATKARCTL
jgi:hypothetical protein